MEDTQVYGDNVKVRREGTKFIIEVETDGVTPHPSASGKTMVYASTLGNQQVGDGYTLGLNFYRKR